MSKSYEPWKGSGISETDYWKGRYIESRREYANMEQQAEQLQARVKSLEEENEKLRIVVEAARRVMLVTSTTITVPTERELKAALRELDK